MSQLMSMQDCKSQYGRPGRVRTWAVAVLGIGILSASMVEGLLKAGLFLGRQHQFGRIARYRRGKVLRTPPSQAIRVRFIL